jgi:hypothetical protein
VTEVANMVQNFKFNLRSILRIQLFITLHR